MILGIKTSKTFEGLILSQSHCIETTLRKYNTFNGPEQKTLVDFSLHLGKNNSEPISQLEYSRVIGFYSRVLGWVTVYKLSR